MKKKLLSLLLCSLFFTGCTNNNKKDENEKNTLTESSIAQTSSTNFKVTLPSNLSKNIVYNFNKENIYHTLYTSIGELLFFSDANNNNKLSVTTTNIDNNYILAEDIISIFDYSVESLISANNKIYFTDFSNSNSLYQLDYEKQTVSLISNDSFSKISALGDNIIYINPKENSTINSYNLKTNTSTLIANDKCGSYIINNDYILYKNLSNNSLLYIVSKDGSTKEKLTDVGVDSFVAFDNYILYISASDNNLYYLDLATKKSSPLNLINGTNLKFFNGTFYYISLSDSNHLYSFTINDQLDSINQLIVSDYFINDYFLTEIGIFVLSPMNINKNYFIPYK